MDEEREQLLPLSSTDSDSSYYDNPLHSITSSNKIKCQESKKEDDISSETDILHKIISKCVVHYEDTMALLSGMMDEPPEIEYNAHFRCKYGNFYQNNHGFMPFVGLFPLCPTKNSPRINSTLQFLLASANLKTLEGTRSHENRQLFDYMREVRNIYSDVRQVGVESENVGFFLIPSILKNTDLIKKLVSLLANTKTNLYMLNPPEDLLQVILATIAYNSFKSHEEEWKIFSSYKLDGIFCKICNIFYRNPTMSNFIIIFPFDNFGRISIQKQLKRIFLSPKDFLKGKIPSIFCELFHRYFKYESLRFRSSPQTLFLKANYDKTDKKKSSKRHALKIPQQMIIHGVHYYLKAAILQHAKPYGDYFQSTLLYDGSQWYHQLNHCGKIVTNIDAVLNYNPDVGYILYEMDL